MWWFWRNLEIKLEETRSCPSNQSRVDNQSHTSIDKHPVSSIESKTSKARLGSQPTYIPIPTTITEIPLTDFNLIFICSAIVLATSTFQTFIFTANIFRVFNILERRSKKSAYLWIIANTFGLQEICLSFNRAQPLCKPLPE